MWVAQYKLAFLKVYLREWCITWHANMCSLYITHSSSSLSSFSCSLSLELSPLCTQTHYPQYPQTALIQASMASDNLSSLHKSCNSISQIIRHFPAQSLPSDFKAREKNFRCRPWHRPHPKTAHWPLLLRLHQLIWLMFCSAGCSRSKKCTQNWNVIMFK